MRSIRRSAAGVVAGLVLVLTLAACELLGVATDPPGTVLARDFAAGRETWAAAGIDDYTFTVRYGCFCPEQVTGPFRITVVDGAPTEVRYADGRPVVELGMLLAPVTIEALFAKAETALGADEVAMTFDPRWGFPAEITVDPIENAVDEEWSVAVTEFAPAP